MANQFIPCRLCRELSPQLVPWTEREFKELHHSFEELPSVGDGFVFDDDFPNGVSVNGSGRWRIAGASNDDDVTELKDGIFGG